MCYFTLVGLIIKFHGVFLGLIYSLSSNILNLGWIYGYLKFVIRTWIEISGMGVIGILFCQ